MRINLILIPFVIILGLLMSFNDSKPNRAMYIIICSIIFVLVAALRNPEWLALFYRLDTLSYKTLFELTSDMSWGELWDSFHSRYVVGEEDEDIGFTILMKLIGSVTHSFYIFSLLADLLFFIPFGIILYRYSTKMRQLIFAFVFYVSLIQIFLLGGARQIFSIGFDLIALLFIIDGKKWRALLFFTLGITVHFSSFLFIIPLIMVWLDVSSTTLKWTHVVCFIVFPIIFLFPNQVVLFLGRISGVERYTNYGLGVVANDGNFFLLLIELLSLFCLFAIKKADLQNNQSYRTLYVMTPFFTIFAPLIQSNGAMIRVCLYYYLFLVLLVPYAIDCMFKKDENIVYFIVIGLLSFLALSGGTRYYFFWQNPF